MPEPVVASPVPKVEEPQAEEVLVEEVAVEEASEEELNENEIKNRNLRAKSKEVSSEVASLRDALTTEEPVGKRRARKKEFNLEDFQIIRPRKKKVENPPRTSESELVKDETDADGNPIKTGGKGRGRPTKGGGRNFGGKKGDKLYYKDPWKSISGP